MYNQDEGVTLSALQIKTYTTANSVDSDGTAHNDVSHQTIKSLPFNLDYFMSDVPTFNNAHIQIKRQKSPIQKLREEMVKLKFLTPGPSCSKRR